MRHVGAGLVATGAATILSVGVLAVVTRGAIPRSYDHRIDGNVTVTVDVTVRTPDLGKLKPGPLIPERITIVLPEGFTLRLPDSSQTVDVDVPTDYTVHNAP